jgi:hypothetical protein
LIFFTEKQMLMGYFHEHLSALITASATPWHGQLDAGRIQEWSV